MPTTSETLHRDIHEAVVAVLQEIDFGDEIPTGRVYDETILGDAELNIEYPCVVASIEGEAERVATPRTVGKRQLEFPVRVFILDRDSEVQANEAKYTRWRQLMMTAFDQRPRDATTGRVLGATDVYDCEVVPKVVFDEKLPQYQMVVSGFVVWAKVFVQR